MKNNKFSKFFSIIAWIDKIQKNGSWVPAFPKPSKEKEEEYIERMIKRDNK